MSLQSDADQAQAGTPPYGDFGKANETEPAVPTASSSNDGSNDNPDEFSEFRKPDAPPTENYSPDAEASNPQQQRGHVTQNQATDEVVAAEHADTDVQRAAWAADDPRYAGGHAKASWKEQNEKEHDNN